MISKGFVYRFQKEKDRRNIYIGLTPLGKELVENTFEMLHGNLEEQLDKHTTEEERIKLTECYEYIYDILTLVFVFSVLSGGGRLLENDLHRDVLLYRKAIGVARNLDRNSVYLDFLHAIAFGRQKRQLNDGTENHRVAVFQFVYYQRLGKNKLSVYDGAALGSILPNRKACKHFT